jgi:hypothetical membrane protein
MKAYRYLGVASALVPYFFIALSVVGSPWFNFYSNALSDLGNYTKSSVAEYYNLGLVITGVMICMFSLAMAFDKRRASYISLSIFLFASGLALSLVGLFSENSGNIHGLVSTLFFWLIDVTLLVYSYLSWPIGSPKTGAISLGLGIASAAVWATPWPWHGVAIQETVTSVMAALWLLTVSIFVLNGRTESPKV